MQTLTYGFKLPEAGDKGSVWFPALEENIEQLDGHNHNGTNSAKIPSSSINNLTQTIDSANWEAVGDGTGRYRQALSLPGGLLYDALKITMKDSDGNIMFLDVEKINLNSYYVYINDSSKNLLAIYG